MRYRQTLVLTVYVDDSTFDAGWPTDIPWEFLLQEHLERNGHSTEHVAVDVASIDPGIIEQGYDADRYDYSPGDWRYMCTEPVECPYYVNVYSVGQGYGGPEEGGWWFSTGDHEHTEIAQTREDAERVREQLIERYPSTRAQYSVLGGDDWDVRIEDHPGEGWPHHRPHYE